jgi:hypothetical protein
MAASVTTGKTAWARNLAAPVRHFLSTETGGAVALLVATVAALAWANSPGWHSYESVWTTHLAIRIGDTQISRELREWINEGLMTFYFLVVGLEAKRERVIGQLREGRRIALPVVAALCGMAVPVLIFLAINGGGHGWGAAMSTDTAFALGLLALVARDGTRLRIRLLTASVVDDLVALVVIAVAYSGHVSFMPLLIAAALLAALRLRDRPDARSAALLGGAVALAALTRSEALALLPLSAWPVALSRPAGRLRLLAVATLAAALVIAPWTARNWIEFGRPVLISTNDGTLLAGANCALTYHGIDVGFWSIDCISERTIANEAAQEARWRSEGLAYARENAGRVPAVLAVRVLRTWDLYQPRRMVRFAEGRWIHADQAGIVVYFLLLPLAFAGGWLLRARRGELLVLLTPVALVLLLSLVGYGIPRFRAPAEIAIVVLAAVALARLRKPRSA